MIKPNFLTRFFLKNKPKGYIPKHMKNILDFSSLVNVLGFSQKVKQATGEIDFNLINQYGDRDCLSLKQKITRRFDVSVSSVSLGNGSDELIDCISRIFVNPGEVVIIQTPTFFRVIESSLKMKAKVKTVKAEERENFSLNDRFVDSMIKMIKKHKPKIVWLCTPCNPTGVTISLDNIRRIALSTKEIIIVDEVYHELFDPENKQSAIKLLAKHKNILVLKSFSKAFGLAGIRVGFAVGDPKIIEIIEKTRLNFNIGIFSQKIAEIALEDIDFIKDCSSFFAQERALLFPEINKLTNIILGAESKVNVFILKHKTKDLFQELLHHGILTADFRQANGLERKGFVRVTIKTRQENSQLLKVLKEIN